MQPTRSLEPALGFVRYVAQAALLAIGCGDPNTGVDPPRGSIFFPEGLMLDPRTPEGEAARYLFVSNGNNDLAFSGSSVSVIDLEAFFDAWTSQAEDGARAYIPYPYCEGAGGRCVAGVGTTTSSAAPCRRLGLLPHVVECDETPFVVDGVRLGDFSTLIESSIESSGIPRLWIPVRGDPSVTFVDVRGQWPGPPDLDCGQQRAGGERVDESRCDDAFKLTHLRNDNGLDELAREPFSVHVTTGEGYRYGFVSHSATRELTLIDLDGLRGADGRPAIVDIQDVFQPATAGLFPGGYGLATRPCGACGEGDVPAVTQGCTRPLVYGSLRYELNAASFTASGISEAELPTGAATRTSCEDETGTFVGAYCAQPEDVGQPCALVCEPRLNSVALFPVGGIDVSATTSSAALGEVEFGDACGNDLYILQTNPGALIRLDTSLVGTEPLDAPAGAPIELCDQPSRFEIWQDHGLAFVSCFQAAYVYVVDLRANRVVDTVITGTGPHDVALDEVRQMLYVTNLLEGSISVIDVGDQRPTRYNEVARIGLQEPYSQ